MNALSPCWVTAPLRLTTIAGFSPKLDPKVCACLERREVDRGERELSANWIRVFTMRESMSVEWTLVWTKQSQSPPGVLRERSDIRDCGMHSIRRCSRFGYALAWRTHYRDRTPAMEKIAEAGACVHLKSWRSYCARYQ